MKLLLLTSAFWMFAMSSAMAQTTVVLLQAGPSAEPLAAAIERIPGIELRKTAGLTAGVLKGASVLIAVEAIDPAQHALVHAFCERGGGAMLLNRAAEAATSSVVFPELIRSGGLVSTSRLVAPSRPHAVTRGVDAKGFFHSFWSHRTICPVDDRTVLLHDLPMQDDFTSQRVRGTQLRWRGSYGGGAVMVAGPVGKGRAIVCGLLMGLDAEERVIPIEGDERKLLEQSLVWLENKSPLGVPGKLRPSEPSQYAPDNSVAPPAYTPGAVKLTAQTTPAATGTVHIKIARDGTVGVIEVDRLLRMTLADEGGAPSIQALQLYSPGWTHTWDGLERQTWSAPLLRLSPSFWPYRKLFPSYEHEIGAALPSPGPDAEMVTTHAAVVQVGKGRVEVRADGTIRLEGIHNQGALATYFIDGYQSADRNVPEATSYDVPEVAGQISIYNTGWFTLSGQFSILDKLVVTGQAPGVQRLFTLNGPQIKIHVQTTHREKGVVMLPRQALHICALERQRGNPELWGPRPAPVEIDNKALEEAPVERWQLQGLGDSFELSAGALSPPATSVEDQVARNAMAVDDPNGEESSVARRFYIHYIGEISGRARYQGRLAGLNKANEAVLIQPLEIEVGVSIPIGIFTYFPMWYYRQDITPAENWPKLQRDIALSGLDYVIHAAYPVIDESTGKPLPETPQRVGLRMLRNGLWWLASLEEPSHHWYNRGKPGDIAVMTSRYRKAVEQFGNWPNRLGWYMSDEIPNDSPGLHDISYQSVARMTVVLRSMDHDRSRPLIHLFSPYFTTYERAGKELTRSSEVFSWDPYNIGPDPALAAAKRARSVTDQPLWVTLQTGGATFYDTVDDWMHLRQRSIAAFRGGVDNINYFMYAHWLNGFQEHQWSAVQPGPGGPVATTRWQGVRDSVEDLRLLSAADQLLRKCNDERSRLLAVELDQAMDLGQRGYFYSMRQRLEKIIAQLSR